MTSSYSIHSLFDVDGIVAVITGGGSGVGKVITHSLVANGAKAVYVLGRRQEPLLAAKESSLYPHRVHIIICDVTLKESLEDAVRQIRIEVGYVDVMFANSGITSAEVSVMEASCSASSLQAKLWEPTIEDFTSCFRVNVAGAFYSAVAFLELLDQGNNRAVLSQTSQIIFTSSIGAYARLPAKGFAYSASKAAVAHMAQQLATVLAPLKIRVNSIAPGFYPTEGSRNLAYVDKSSNALQECGIKRDIVPLERLVTEEDIAGVTLFLVSRAGAYVDGATLAIDGGRMCIIPTTH